MTRWFPKNQTLNFILLGALAAVVSVEFVLADIPEFFSGAAKIGSIVSALSVAYIASYIFYVVVVHIKHVRDSEHIHPYIALKTRQIVAGLREITLQIVVRANGDSNVAYPSQQEFSAMTKGILLGDPAPEAYTRIPAGVSSWLDFLKYWKQLTEERIDALFANAQFLEAEHVRLLLNIRENPFFFQLRMFSESILKQDCSFLASTLYRLSESTRALETYCEEHFIDVARFEGGG